MLFRCIQVDAPCGPGPKEKNGQHKRDSRRSSSPNHHLVGDLHFSDSLCVSRAYSVNRHMLIIITPTTTILLHNNFIIYFHLNHTYFFYLCDLFDLSDVFLLSTIQKALDIAKKVGEKSVVLLLTLDDKFPILFASSPHLRV